MQNETLEFFVPGIPKPGGSKRAFVHRHTGRVVVTEDCRVSKDWRRVVAEVADKYMDGRGWLSGPLAVSFLFCFPRLKQHFGKGRNASALKDSAARYHSVKPDATKVVRSTEDALKGIMWADDSQIAVQHVEKVYGDRPGVTITVKRLT